jgi:hypothetical protein
LSHSHLINSHTHKITFSPQLNSDLFLEIQVRTIMKHCDNDGDFTTFLASVGTTPVIVDFFADW